MPENDVTLTGRIVDSRGPARERVTVRAFLRLRRALPGAETPRFGVDAVTDADGVYLNSANRDQTPEQLRGAGVFIRVLRDEVQLGESELVRVEVPQTVLDLVVENGDPEEPEEPDGRARRVYGVVRDGYGDLRDDVTVQAFDRDLRTEQLLGSSPAPAGRYEVRYEPSQFHRSDKLSADLVLKVLDGQGQELYRTPVRYNMPDDAEIDIAFTGRAYRGSSQWDEQTGALTPLLEDVAPQELREDEEFQDITFLAGETGYDPLAIGTWAACFRLAEKTHREESAISPEAFYAFLAQGQPSIFHDSLREDIRHPDRLVLLEDKLLRGLADLTPVLQRRCWTRRWRPTSSHAGSRTRRRRCSARWRGTRSGLPGSRRSAVARARSGSCWSWSRRPRVARTSSLPPSPTMRDRWARSGRTWSRMTSCPRTRCRR